LSSNYLFIFVLNLAVEFVIALAFLHVRFWKRILVMEVLLNIATHPVLWWVLPKLPGPYVVNLCAAEVVVAAMEVSLALLFFRAHFERARIVAAVLTANVTTFLMTFVV
jgi:hypothetical protein